MGLISESGRSSFPLEVDTFPDYVDSQEKKSVTNADIFNNIQASIYTTQSYALGIPRVVEAGGAGEDRYVIPVHRVFAVKKSRPVLVVPIELPQSVVTLLGANWSRLGNMVFASVRRFDGVDGDQRAFRAWPQPVSSTQINVAIDHIDPSRNLSPGTYYLSVLLIGR